MSFHNSLSCFGRFSRQFVKLLAEFQALYSGIKYKVSKGYKLILVTCPPVHLSHGQINANKLSVNGKYPYNTTISFSCDSGYSLDTTGIGSAHQLHVYRQDIGATLLQDATKVRKH